MKVFQRDRLIGQPVTTNDNIYDIMKLEFGIITTAQQHFQHLMTQFCRNSRLKVLCILFSPKVAVESLCATNIYRHLYWKKSSHSIVGYLQHYCSCPTQSYIFILLFYLIKKGTTFSVITCLFSGLQSAILTIIYFQRGTRSTVRKSQILTRSQPVSEVRNPSVK